MHQQFSLLLFLLFFCVISAQTITVVDENNVPISEAVIEIYPQEDFLFSNIHGKFKLSSNLEVEELTVFHPNYESVTVEYAQLANDGYKIMMSQCNLILDEIVFTANKFYEKKSIIPQQIEQIRPQSLELQGSATTAEILSNSGKVFVQKSQLGGGSPNIRGFEANKILLVVDGVRMNNAIFRGGHLQNVITTNANAIDNIEVLYGAGSVIYGSDALGGVINISSSKAFINDSLQLDGKIYSLFGSASNEKNIGTIVNLGGAKVGSLTGFNYHFYGDLRQGAQRNKAIGDLGLRPFYAINDGEKDIMVPNTNANVQRFSGYRQYNFLQKFLIQPNDLIQHKINLQYSTTSNIPRYDRLSEMDDNGVQKNVDWYYGPQDWLLLSYEFQKSGDFKFYDQSNFIVAYQNFKESRHTRKFDNPERRNQMESVDAVNVNLSFKKNFKKQFIAYGFESYYNDVNSRAYHNNIYNGNISAANTRYPDGGSKMGSVAMYISNQQSFKDKKLYLQEGLRYTYTYLKSLFNVNDFPIQFSEIKQHSSNLSGNVGLVYKPESSTRLAINVNTGFRAPNVDDISKIFDSSPGNLIIPNPNLKPEKTIGTDVEFSKVFKNIIKLETVLFFTAFRDMISTQNSSYMGRTLIEYDGVLSQIQQQKNVGRANIYGVNFYLESAISSKIKANASFTYTHGRVLASPDYPMDHIPPIFGELDVQYKLKKWQFVLYSIYNGKKPIDEYNPFGEDNERYATPEGMPAWWTLNFKSNFNLNKNFSILMGVENIFDRNYRVFASGISAPGRNFLFRINYLF